MLILVTTCWDCCLKHWIMSSAPCGCFPKIGVPQIIPCLIGFPGLPLFSPSILGVKSPYFWFNTYVLRCCKILDSKDWWIDSSVSQLTAQQFQTFWLRPPGFLVTPKITLWGNRFGFPMAHGASHEVLEEGREFLLDWQKLKKVAACESPVVPVCVQDADTMQVLIVAFANEQAFWWRNCQSWRGVITCLTSP